MELITQILKLKKQQQNTTTNCFVIEVVSDLDVY